MVVVELGEWFAEKFKSAITKEMQLAPVERVSD